jgi:hypothetical protein
MATSFSDGRSRREPPATGKQLVKSSAPFFLNFIHKPNISEADYINNHILDVFKYVFNIQLLVIIKL